MPVRCCTTRLRPGLPEPRMYCIWWATPRSYRIRMRESACGFPRRPLLGSSVNKGHDNTPTRTLATPETPASRRESVATAGSARRQRLRPRAEGIPRRAQGGRCPPEVSGIHVGRTNSTTARTIAAKRRARLRMSTAFSPIVHGGERRWRTDTPLWLRSTRCLVSRRSRSLGPTVSPSACGPIIISTPC